MRASSCKHVATPIEQIFLESIIFRIPLYRPFLISSASPAGTIFGRVYWNLSAASASASSLYECCTL